MSAFVGWFLAPKLKDHDAFRASERFLLFWWRSVVETLSISISYKLVKEFPMTTLRHKLIRDLTLRGRAQTTIKEYVRIIRDLSCYYKCSPDSLNNEQLQDFLYYLATERGYAQCSVNVARTAIFFFFRSP